MFFETVEYAEHTVESLFAIKEAVDSRCPPTGGDDVRCPSLRGVHIDPIGISFHPALEERPAGRTNTAVGFKQVVVHLEKHLGLAERWDVEIGEHVAQVLLRKGRADGTDGNTDDTRWFSTPHALAVGTRGMIDGVFETPGIDLLYSGVTNRSPSAAAISDLSRLTSGA